MKHCLRSSGIIEKIETPEGDGNSHAHMLLSPGFFTIEKIETPEGDGNPYSHLLGAYSIIEKIETPEGDGNPFR